MKTKLFVVASMLIMGMSSFAQSSIDGWNTIYLQWNPSTYVPDKGDSESFNGLSVGYNRAISISQSLPLYLEVGLGVQYSFFTKDITEEVAEGLGVTTAALATLFRPEEKVKMFSAKVPVSLAYAFHVPDTKLTLIPYLGLDLRCNIIGRASAKYNLTSAGLEQLLQAGFTKQEINENLADKDLDLFDKNDMGSDAATWNRLQVGWHVGLNARINEQFLIGASYGTDFSEITQKVNIHTASLTVGYCF
ncbi:Outer membrane protein beta-barrel domain-containing protein [Prevotellaceae bacterium HUN156]|nr:Outer membrane protein beta-barrel domain-containing protein [Prevotellaceae bacterium HUN156]